MKPTSKKPLLVFAYKGEASHFLSSGKSRARNELMADLWEMEDYFILVTGEGTENCVFSLTRAISHLAQEIEYVVNLGIAGALVDSVEALQIIEPSVVIGEASALKLHHKSFEIRQASHKFYLVSAGQRVKTDDYRTRLAAFGELVDREAWAVGFVSERFKLNFYCIKLISDMAGPETICFDIKEKSAEYSRLLFEYYAKKSLLAVKNASPESDLKTDKTADTKQESRPHSGVNKKNDSRYSLIDSRTGDSIAGSNDSLYPLIHARRAKPIFESFEASPAFSELVENIFHFSKTQKSQLLKWQKLLSIKSPGDHQRILCRENITSIASEFNRPKDRSRVLLEELQSALNPFHQTINTRLNEWFGNRPASVKQVQTDPIWEQNYIKLAVQIETESDRDDLLQYIKQLPLEEFHKIFEGQF